MAVSFDSVGGVTICLVKVAPSPKAVYVKEGDNKLFYVRLGNSSHLLNTAEAVIYIGERWQEA
jgi:hypothetical protein